MFLPEMKLFYGVFFGKDHPVSEDVAVMNFDGMVWVDQGKSRGVESKSSFRLVVQGQCLSFGSCRRRLKEEGSVGGVRKCRRKDALPPTKGAISVESDHGPSRGGQGSSVARVFLTPRTVWA